MAGGGAESGGRDRGTRGKSGRLPPQRLVHGLALKELGSDRGRREAQKTFKLTYHKLIKAADSDFFLKEEITHSSSYK